MVDFFYKLGWKKASAVLFTFVFIMLLFIVLTFNEGMNPKVLKAPPIVPSPTSVSSLKKSESSTNEWSTYKNSMFQIIYPKEFVPAETLTNEANIAAFSSPDNSTSIGVEAYKSGVSFQGIVNLFTLMKYKQENIKIAGYDAILFKGSGIKQGQNFQEEAVVVQAGTSIYKIQLFYISPEASVKTEDIFNKMVSSFILF